MTDLITPEAASALARILAGESSLDDHIFVQQWIAADPERAKQVANVYRIWGEGSTLAHEGDVVAFLNRLHRAIPDFHSSTAHSISVANADIPMARTNRRSPSWFRSLHPRMSIVAGVATMAALFAIGSHFIPASTQDPTSDPVASNVSVYSTGNGQRAKIMLPDGSSIDLNVKSRVEVPVDYGGGNRTIRLEGEALFTVRHNSAIPMQIVAGTSITRVLGTSFLVRSYEEDTAVTVAVREGKVAVNDVVLVANEQLNVSQRAISSIHIADHTRFTFADGVLTLNEMTLSEAIITLNRWYDADIRLADESLKGALIRGQFPAGSLLELTEQLTAGLDVVIERNGRTVTLKRRAS